ncbi:hypothetical protein VTO73DRAFT_15237 [Trametes versicolor]
MVDASTPQSHQYLPSCHPTDDVDPGTISVSNFLTTLAESYKKLEDVPHFSRARIRSLEFRKETVHVQHEFLLLFITVDGRPWADAPLGILKCERHIHNLNDSHWAHIKSFVVHLKLKDHTVRTAPQVDAESAAAAAAAVSFGLKGSLKASSYIPAADRFIFYTPEEIADIASPANYVLYRHEYEAPPVVTGELDPNLAASDAHDEPPSWHRTSNVSPTLYHLAAVTATFHERWPEYILMHRQCYWYAAVVYHALGGQDERLEDTALPAQTDGIEDAFRPESERNPPPVDSANAAAPSPGRVLSFFRLTPGPAGSFGTLFKLVTRSDVEELYDKENLSAAIETRVAAIYGTLRDKVSKIREEKTKDELLLQLTKEMAASEEKLKAYRVEAAEKLEALEAAAAQTADAHRAFLSVMAKEREAEQAAAAQMFEAASATMAQQLDAERAAVAKEREAERAETATKLTLLSAQVEAEKEAAAKKLAAQKALFEARIAEEVAVTNDERFAALAEEHAAALARLAEFELERRLASGVATPSGSEQER